MEVAIADNKNTVQDEADIITLEFEDGVTIECEVMGIFDHNGQDYIALIPQDDSDDVYIYGYKELDDDEFELVDIEDDALFGEVVEVFDTIMESEEEN